MNNEKANTQLKCTSDDSETNDCMACSALGMCQEPMQNEAREWKKLRQGWVSK